MPGSVYVNLDADPETENDPCSEKPRGPVKSYSTSSIVEPSGKDNANPTLPACALGTDSGASPVQLVSAHAIAITSPTGRKPRSTHDLPRQVAALYEARGAVQAWTVTQR